MKPTAIVPEYDYEDVVPDDVIDGITTLKGRYGQGLILTPPGEGPDKLLNWAVQEVEQASRASSRFDPERLAANAMINARRSLACLVDWCLERDLATQCASPPSSAKQKADFLVERGIIDGLTACVLERAIAKRNAVEHQYTSPSIEVARDFVELLRRTIYAIRVESEPAHAPWLFGVFLYSSGVGKHGPFAEVHGWSDPLIVLQRFEKPTWAGILLPKSGPRATIRRANFKAFTSQQIVRMLSGIEQRYGRPTSFSSADLCRVMARAMRIEDAPTTPPTAQ